MNIFFALFSLFSLSLAVPVPEADPSPAAYASDYGYYLPVNSPSSQYHSQDDLGQYNYGYQSADQTKSEVKTADGVVRGSYSYVDANGLVQTVNYISDALGFRVAATNLPIHHIDAPAAVVEAAPQAVVEAVVEAAPSAEVMTPNVPYAYLPYAANYDYHVLPTQYINAASYIQPASYGQTAPIIQAAPAVYAAAPLVQDAPAVYAAAPLVQAAPVVYAAAPLVQAAPVVYAAAPLVQATPEVYAAAPVVYAAAPVVQAAPLVYAAAPVVQAAPEVYAAAPISVVASGAAPDSSQYHAQDEFGQYSFGYSDENSVRQETKALDGTVTGAYRYVDSNGRIQTVEYIADEGGFRVAGTNLPIFYAEAPVDTPEVAAAKVQHAAAYAAVAAAAGDDWLVEEAGPAAYYGAGLPYNFAAAPVVEAAEESYVYAAAPVVQAAPVVYAAAPVVQAAPAAYAAASVAQAAPFIYAAAPVVQAAPFSYDAAPAVYAAAPAVYSAAPAVYAAAPAVYAAAPAVYSAAASPVVVINDPAAPDTQYHSQDDFGQYSYGYSDSNSIKHEVKTADGAVRGSYSYVDSDGLVQTVNYIADALGFRVGATNLPVHHIAAAAAPAAEQLALVESPVVAAYEAAPVDTESPAMSPLISYSYLPYATNYGYNLPLVQTEAAPEVVVAAAPATVLAAAPVPAADVNTQFHAQDEFGQYNYGYSNPTQSKSEIKTADGVTRGTYSYVDANGLIQTVNYISDAMGFRVAATNLPVHHIEAEEQAPAVEAAKYSVLTPSVNYAYLPYAQNYGYGPAAA